MLHYTFKFVKPARFYDSGISNKNSQDEGYLKEGYKKGKTEPGVKSSAFSKENEYERGFSLVVNMPKG